MALLALVLIGFAALGAIVLVVRNVLYVCQPNEVLIFSGRSRVADGRHVSYRIIKGGRALRVPLIETVDRMDLTNMTIEVTVKNAYSRGGIPLMVQGVANIKVPGEEPLIHNALQRFLGKTRDEIMRIARETLEGNLRGVLATLTPEQVNQDKEAFAGKLAEEAEHDLNTIGLVLDTLKIQNVADDVGYLDALGRMRSAHIRRNAQVAEAEAQAEAAEVKWDNFMRGELAKLDSQIAVARKENERRIADATTRREAMIAEQRAEVQAGIAQARAEVDMQTARIEQVRLQLAADVVKPAEARMREEQARAKAGAASIIEQGKATAHVLEELATTYRANGEAGRDVLLMQQLVPLLQKVSGTIGELHVDRLTVIGKGEANGAGDDSTDPLAARLVNAAEQIKAATGLDVPELLRERLQTQ
ncbi:MAG: flotillin family protein [Myxococcota bacterium]